MDIGKPPTILTYSDAMVLYSALSAELKNRCVTRLKWSRLNSQALSREPLIKFSSVVPPCNPRDPVSMGEEVAEQEKN